MMSSVRELVNALKGHLATFGYSECVKNVIGNVNFAAVLTSPKRPKKLLCAVADLPKDAADARTTAEFLDRIRRGLAKEFVRIPWPGRLGTHLVLLADHATCERLRGKEAGLIDISPKHVNVLLGMILVDVESLCTRSATTWRLMGTEEQFREIQAAVEQWCQCRRSQDHPPSPGTWSMRV